MTTTDDVEWWISGAVRAARPDELVPPGVDIQRPKDTPVQGPARSSIAATCCTATSASHYLRPRARTRSRWPMC
ncbi:MAG: hypothetical protein M0C28_32990 [Candidatus Moduliflexus flocculans]|nr:hypothetical protein [Candidatus Moduliflexus flocculans]